LNQTAVAENPNREFAIGMARACGGAIIFSLPLIMTMEMWWLGYYMDRARLLLLVLVMIPLLIRLSSEAGFEETVDWRDDVVDAFVALGVGFALSAASLWLIGVLTPDLSITSMVAMVTLLAVPGSIGAMLGRAQLGTRDDQEPADPSWAEEIFHMLVGALFLAFNVAPTEEMVLIAYRMTPWHALALAVVSLIVMHAFVYAVEFRGHSAVPPGTPEWSVFLRFTAVGYAVALCISLYVLWTFGRADGTGAIEVTKAVLVLGFPAAIGAASARLIL
jgi:putative integral membrane protein (TIGR02587 family)